ncbi:hypothetical protein [Microbispora sp. KK1-11]|uniref:hypothetical protein n=1 Tax=Microbispora sp. KK1-11 TaxID=2053005 RepID=UPI00115AC1D5|nr:hypothetical protein [Microbispora sp. KK1-11]TQS28370.1 hypothetical protein FLW16_16130 [Microbispora sp. KK1-11]
MEGQPLGVPESVGVADRHLDGVAERDVRGGHPNVARRSNIVLSKADSSSTQFVPLGNGTLGAPAWGGNGSPRS